LNPDVDSAELLNPDFKPDGGGGKSTGQKLVEQTLGVELGAGKTIGNSTGYVKRTDDVTGKAVKAKLDRLHTDGSAIKHSGATKNSTLYQVKHSTPEGAVRTVINVTKQKAPAALGKGAKPTWLIEAVVEKPDKSNRGLAEGAVSYDDIRSMLQSELEPASDDPSAVAPTSMKFIEAVFADHFIYQDGPKMFRQTYALSEDGKPVVSGEPSEVTRKVTYEVASEHHVVEYEVVQASAATCGCGGRAGTSASAEEDGMKPKKERVAAIISSGKTCFVAADAAVLEQLPDERIKALEEQVVAAAAPPFTVKEDEMTEEEKKKLEEEKMKAEAAAKMAAQASFFKENPEIAALVAAHKNSVAARRASLVGQLKTAQKAYTEVELQALPTETLEKVALLALKEKPSYEGAGFPRAASDGSDEEIPAPPSLSKRFRDAQLKGSAN
jgi:hypothetical protein